MAANDVARREVLARLEREGPLRTGELPDLTEVPWLSTGWTHEKNLARLLDLMVSRGEVAIAGREGGQRLWDLAERVHPIGSLDVPPYDDALRLLAERRLRYLGIARRQHEAVRRPAARGGDRRGRGGRRGGARPVAG